MIVCKTTMWNGTYFSRQGCNAKYQIQLRNGMPIFDTMGICDILRIGGQHCRSMHHRKQWGPFLEIDIDHQIRNKARRSGH